MLDRIALKKKKRVEEAKARLPQPELIERIKEAGPLRAFAEALFTPGISVIAEVKRRSPSSGDFKLRFAPPDLAARYLAGGAEALSVLTEEDFFQGGSEDLTAVREAAGLPVLRKDFIIDLYQLYESRLLCADAILLIAALLTQEDLKMYLAVCDELGMAALVEVHRAAEITKALRAGARMIGINNRDLRTFRTDINNTIQRAGMVPDEILLVSASGIRTRDDVRKLEAAGADAILVGETLARASDPAGTIRILKGLQPERISVQKCPGEKICHE